MSDVVLPARVLALKSPVGGAWNDRDCSQIAVFWWLFILAETGLRAPLRRGLLNLEYERYSNAWVIVLHRTGATVTLTEEELLNETRACDDEKEQDYVFLGS